MWDDDMIRKFLIGVLSLAAIWLTVMWIATFIWPADYSLLHIFKKFNLQNGQCQMHAGIFVWELKNPNRRFTWVFLEKPNLDPSARPKPAHQFGFLSFMYSANHAVPGNPKSPRMHIVAFPASTSVFIAWLYPIACLIRRPLRQLLRKHRGLCLNCGYNLTGAPQPRCPECGTPIRRSPSDSPQRGEGM
jgi:hypothetical protein